MNTDWISREESPDLRSLTPEEQAARRTHLYGNEGFDERARADSAKIVGVAAGDSWFDYLPARLFAPGDIIDNLNRGASPYNVLRTAIAGDTVENIVWGTKYWTQNWTPQPKRQLPDAVSLIRQRNPRFFLFSGGGNDIAGAPLEQYLNHVDSGQAALRKSQLDWLINTYFATGYRKLIHDVQAAKAGLPIIFHGYDYPVADGRGVIDFPLGYHFIGPWLRPAFAMKRIDEAGRAATLNYLIGSFNDMLKTLADPARNIYYLDLRGTLAAVDPLNYKAGWANELHPTDEGFKRIAEQFAGKIDVALHAISP